LHHLFRGTGPVGLCGIPVRRSLGHDFQLLRPLLGFRGETLRAGLREIGQDWCEDQTNAETGYSRNWIRGELLPVLRNRYPAVDQAILRMVDAQGGWHQLIARLAENWIDTSVHISSHQLSVRQGPVEPAIIGVAIVSLWDRLRWPRRSLGANHYRAIHSLVAAQTDAAITLPGDIHAAVHHDGDGQNRVIFRRADRHYG
jgi:tRNA(Ile)-lysidine synthase